MVAQPNPPDGAANLRAAPRPRHNLPAQPTPLIGRDHEIAALRTRLLDPAVRLLTLTGPPGTGKTRLALATAAALAGDFDDGVWFVPLEAVREPNGVLAAIARVVGIREEGEQGLSAALVVHLSERRLLLVLDNFEHLLPASVQVAELLAGCTSLSVLVTSRAPLRLRWEHEYQVSPLILPDASAGGDPVAVERAPAVELFVARARSTLPQFRLTAENAATVAAICARLDGLPLAIELAAVRTRLLPLPALLDRLAQRLTLLTSGARDLPDRHRTLRAALTWSYDLLPSAEQAAFRRLAVFAGGCTLGAAEDVCGPTVEDSLASLLDHGLLRRDETEPESRLRMLETVREFALESLAASDELANAQQRHAAYFLTLAEAAEPHLTGPEQAEWLARLDAEHDNIRAALAWALAQGETEPALRLVGATGRYWLVRGHLSEGRRWLERALAMGGAAPLRRRALALHAAARLAWLQADFPAARAFAEDSLAIQQELGDKGEIAASLNTLGTIAVRQADYATARTRFAEVLALVRGLGDGWRTAVVLYNLGTVAVEQGDYGAARSFFEESLRLRRDAGDSAGIAASLDALGNLANALGDHGAARALCDEGLALRRELRDRAAIAYSLWNLAMAARYQGDSITARASIEESLALRRGLGDRHGIAWSLNLLGLVALDQGDRATARACWEESLALSQELGSTLGITNCLVGLARVAATLAQPARAARLLGAAEALREPMGYVIPPAERANHEAGVAAVRAALGEDAFAAAWAAGRALSLEEAVADARSIRDEGGGMRDEAPTDAPQSSLIPHPSSLPRGLTAREAEVLRLIAGGHTNREIAATLVLSGATVERHIANLYAKIGARGRADATAFALRHGLA